MSWKEYFHQRLDYLLSSYKKFHSLEPVQSQIDFFVEEARDYANKSIEIDRLKMMVNLP